MQQAQTASEDAARTLTGLASKKNINADNVTAQVSCPQMRVLE